MKVYEIWTTVKHQFEMFYKNEKQKFQFKMVT